MFLEDYEEKNYFIPWLAPYFTKIIHKQYPSIITTYSLPQVPERFDSATLILIKHTLF